jgi:sialic acid synthase SpsE
MEKISMADLSQRLANIASTYATDTVLILGKGPSIDSIPQEVSQKYLTIGINDVEKLLDVDIAVLREEWAVRSVLEHGATANLYFSPVEWTHEGSATVVQVPVIERNQETASMMTQRLLDLDSFAIEEVVFFSALKLAMAIAQFRGRTQRVFLLGFDFDPAQGVSARIDSHRFHPEISDEARTQILAQEYYFQNALYALQGTLLEIHHVGTRPFSSVSTEEFLAEFGPKHERARTLNHVEVVAELTTNHFGDRARLERMIRLAFAADADFIKLQKRSVDTFYAPEVLQSRYLSPFGTTFGEYRRHLELDLDDFEFVDLLCREIGIGWFLSVLDRESYEFAKHIGARIVKLPSTISEHREYLEYVAADFGGSIVLSTGMTDGEYERFVLGAFRDVERVYLLQCNSAYPTPLHDCDVGVVRHYADLVADYPNLVPGYSSHDLGAKASCLAVAAGARMVEKHVKLGHSDWAHFDAVAIDLSTGEFSEFVREIRETELILGQSQKRIKPSEHHKYRVVP